jgi:hypothetical protein
VLHNRHLDSGIDDMKILERTFQISYAYWLNDY